MKLKLARRALGDAAVVAVEGELDLFTAPHLREEVRDAIKKDGPTLVLDLSELSFMDSSGLSVLIEAWRLTRLVTQIATRVRRVARATSAADTHGSMALPGVSAMPIIA